MTYLYVPPAQPVLSSTCPWCREVPMNGAGQVLAGCTCYDKAGAPNPCERARCPAADADGPIDQVRMAASPAAVDGGSCRIASNA